MECSGAECRSSARTRSRLHSPTIVDAVANTHVEALDAIGSALADGEVALLLDCETLVLLSSWRLLAVAILDETAAPHLWVRMVSGASHAGSRMTLLVLAVMLGATWSAESGNGEP